MDQDRGPNINEVVIPGVIEWLVDLQIEFYALRDYLLDAGIINEDDMAAYRRRRATSMTSDVGALSGELAELMASIAEIIARSSPPSE